MEESAYRPILKRVGIVLVVAGMVDVGWMVYCIIHKTSYSSSINLFAVAAGALLIRGSLRAASLVGWFSILLVSGAGAALLAWPAVRPMDLTLTEIRLNKGPAVVSITACLLVAAISYWVSAELGQERIQKAIDDAGVKRVNVRWAVAAGIGLVICGTVAWNLLVGGESAQQMISMAAKEVGPGYHLQVKSLRISQHYGEKSVTGVVTAWKDGEIRDVPVHWETGRNP